jgi:hypothetical protein
MKGCDGQNSRFTGRVMASQMSIYNYKLKLRIKNLKEQGK